MPIYQAFNKRNKSWVKYEFTKKGIKILNVKERNPLQRFKGIQVRRRRKK